MRFNLVCIYRVTGVVGQVWSDTLKTEYITSMRILVVDCLR